MKKFSQEQISMKHAEVEALQSYCERKQVGAVITRNGRIVSSGYNGTVSGSDNCCEEKVYDGFGVQKVSKNTVVHAEANAILFAAKHGVPTNGCEMFLTLSPCIECAKMIIQSGIKMVYYKEVYRDMAGMKFLEENNIPCIMLNV